ncbi:MAG: hypothetical protein ABWX96_16015 [Propionibacteriaceae bacterium]
MTRFKPVWLLHLAAAVVAVVYVAAMIMLHRLVGQEAQLSTAAVVFGVVAMFTVTCAFVLAFAAAVRSDAY